MIKIFIQTTSNALKIELTLVSKLEIMDKSYFLFEVVLAKNYEGTLTSFKEDIVSFFSGLNKAKLALVFPTHDNKLYLAPLDETTHKKIKKAIVIVGIELEINDKICLKLCGHTKTSDFVNISALTILFFY